MSFNRTFFKEQLDQFSLLLMQKRSNKLLKNDIHVYAKETSSSTIKAVSYSEDALILMQYINTIKCLQSKGRFQGTTQKQEATILAILYSYVHLVLLCDYANVTQ